MKSVLSRISRRAILALLAALAAAWPFRRVPSAPAVGRVEPPAPPTRFTQRYVNIFNREGRSYEVVPLDADGRLPPRLRHLEPLLDARRRTIAAPPAATEPPPPPTVRG